MEDLQNVIKKANDAYALLSLFSVEQEKLKKKVEELFAEISKKLPIQEHKDCVEKVKQNDISIREQIQQLRDNCDQLHAKDRDCMKELKDCSDAIAKVMELHDKSNVRIDSAEKKSKSGIDDALDTIHACIAKLRIEMIARIESLPIPKDHVNIDQVNEAIELKLEPVRLDAKNSLLNAKNHDLRLCIAEKKVEGLMIQMKNYEFKK